MVQALESELRINVIRMERNATLEISTLVLKSETDLLELANKAVATVLVLGLADAERIIERFRTVVRDHGTQGRSGAKNQTLQLSRYFSKKSTESLNRAADLIRASYYKDGQAIPGISALLKKPWASKRIFLIAVEEAVFRALLRRAQSDKTKRFSHPCYLNGIPDDVIQGIQFKGDGPAFIRVRKQIKVAAGNAYTVLIQGESGTGKDLVATAIHKLSARSQKRFVSLDTAAIPMDLLEMELFGVEAGVVTGVRHQKIGLWEQANKGTLFLDEIGNMSLYHQAKIMRTLSTNTIRRVGGNKDIPVDARIVAATNRDLMAMIAKGEFMGDLYYRISNMEIFTPSLNQSPAVLRELALKEWQKIRGDEKALLSGEIIGELSKYTVLSNYRGLQNALRRLDAYMNAEGLVEVDRQYFVAMMQRPTFRAPVMDEKETEEEAATYRMECVLNLRQAARCVRQCKVVLRPLLQKLVADGNGLDRILAGIRPLHEELDKLCLDPTAFYSHEVHNELCKFTGRLTELTHRLTGNGKKAPAYWEKNLQAQYELVLTLTQYEIKGLDRS
jgi:DNA-binding NtrC family response regulator